MQYVMLKGKPDSIVTTVKTKNSILAINNAGIVIIANNDAMAIGSIESLQKYGYNIGDKSNSIPVVGIDSIPEAQELIKKGFMTGSVLQDSTAMAEALYTVGMNLVTGKNPIEGTNYQFDNTGVTIILPYKEYKNSSIS